MSPDPAGQGMFMVRYGTGFVSDDHDGRFPESQPEPVQAGVQRTRSARKHRQNGRRRSPTLGRERWRRGSLAGDLRGDCGPVAGGLRGPRPPKAREHGRNGRRRSPVFSGVFARVCCPSPTTNQSGRTVRVGFPMRFSGCLRSHLRPSYAAHTGLRARRGRAYAIPHTRMLLRGSERPVPALRVIVHDLQMSFSRAWGTR